MKIKGNTRILLWVALILILVGAGWCVYRYLTTPYYPLPKPGTCAVIGKLDLARQKTTRFNAQDLYLARSVSANQSGSSPIISFSFSTDPHTVVHDPDGRFAFTDVEPGTYVLIVWMPGLYLVIQNEDGEPEPVVVEADKIIDVGTIVAP